MVPKRLRDELGLTPQTPLRIDVIEGQIILELVPTVHTVEMTDGFPVLHGERDSEAAPITDELVRELLEEVRDERRDRFV